jgi:DNA repair photolyase
LKTYIYRLTTGIRPSTEFAKKKLADYAVNVGLKCSHDCTYCSSGAQLRCHKAFKQIGKSSMSPGFSVIDPDMPEKVVQDAKRIKKRGMVQLCTTVDAWAPDAQEYDLGRRCLEAILDQPGWTVRILTKNAAVAEDFDIIKKHRDRVLVGISLTGTPDKEAALSVIEPNASPISERMKALKRAHKLGLRTYGMLCPLLPGIGNAPEQIDRLVQFVSECGAEEVFAEAVNLRGNGLKRTEEVLRAGGFQGEAAAIAKIRKQVHWSPYVVVLVRDLQKAMRKHMTINHLRILMYSKKLAAEDKAKIREADAGVVWL